MSTITLSEEEYLRLLETVRQLSARLSRLQAIQPSSVSNHVTDVAARLHGSIPLPDGFNERDILEDEILKKHIGNGQGISGH
jgi:hypothetical protein